MTRPRPLPLDLRVARTERLSESLVRIVLGGAELDRLGEPDAADSYVKLLFLDPDHDYPEPIDPAAIREQLPAELWPKLRTYTVRAFDRAQRELTLDVVVHGDRGLAGPWAACAQPGDRALVLGPGGGYTPRAEADWHLLVGDESALPAIAVALERLPADADVTTFVEVRGAANHIPLARPVTWLHHEDATPGDALVEAVRGWTPPAGRGHLFVHGEAGVVRELRRHLRVERGIALEDLSISGYWRAGADDEEWRRIKRDWNQDVERSEQAAVAG